MLISRISLARQAASFVTYLKIDLSIYNKSLFNRQKVDKPVNFNKNQKQTRVGGSGTL